MRQSSRWAGLLGCALLLGGSLGLASGAAAKAPVGTTRKAFPAARVQRVNIDNGQGAVQVRATPNAQARVSVTNTDNNPYCSVSIELNNGVLDIAVLKRGVMRQPCNMDMRVDVPARVPVDLRGRRGSQTVTGMQGALMCKLSDGNIAIHGAVSDLQVQLAHGQLTAEGLVGSGKIDVTKGSAALRYTSSPKAGRLVVQADQGDVSIGLPDAALFTADARATGGVVENEFLPRADAPFAIQVSAGKGNVSIHKVRG